MKPAPEKKPHAIAAAKREARAIVEGPFREGARAMREAILAKLQEPGGPILARIKDLALPILPETTPKPVPGWGWWAGRDGEWFTIGPCASREAAINEARGEFDGEGFHIIEAQQGAVRFTASSLIETQYLEADDLFDYDHAEPDRTGGADLIATADAELQALLDGWVDRWRHTFITPNMFSATRNAEFVPGEIAEAGPLTEAEEAELAALEHQAEHYGKTFSAQDMDRRYLLRARKAHFAEVLAEAMRS